MSSLFYIGRGTRQSCPLSPVMFALAPLAEWVKEDPFIRGLS